MIHIPFFQSSRAQRISYWIITIALLTGLALSVLSWLEICVEHCSSNRDYRLFGVPFAYVGITYFIALLSSHFLSLKYSFFAPLTGAMMVSGIGAEVMFIAVQKLQIGHWCPVCLSIAATLIVATVAFLITVPVSQQPPNKGKTFMDKFKKSLGTLTFFIIGFLLAFSGISKIDQLQASQDHIKENIELGNKGSPIELYYFTDWFCPSCKKVDPRIEALLPKIQSRVGFYFIDFPVHAKSMNFTPYNLAFLINDKPHYIAARKMLEQLAQETDNPTDEDIETASKKMGLKFKELPYLEVRGGMEYFNKLSEKYKLDSTPTLIILNTKTGKFTRLEGTQEINEKDVLKAIETMENHLKG